MTEFDPKWEGVAAQAARKATCVRSRRGACLTKASLMGVFGMGWDGPPEGFPCGGDAGCRRSCGSTSVHAEERAILNAVHPPEGAELIVVTLANDESIASGPPGCPQCSRLILESGIAGVWLKQGQGWTRWTAEDYHRQTLRNCHLLPRYCEHCDCLLQQHLGDLEYHKEGCPNIPL